MDVLFSLQILWLLHIKISVWIHAINIFTCVFHYFCRVLSQSEHGKSVHLPKMTAAFECDCCFCILGKIYNLLSLYTKKHAKRRKSSSVVVNTVM